MPTTRTLLSGRCWKKWEFGFKGGTLDALENFVTMIQSFRVMLDKHNAYEVAVQVGKSTNIVKELFNDKTTEGLARYENIQELLNSIKGIYRNANGRRRAAG